MIRTGIFEIQRVLKLLYYEALLKNKTKSTININKPYKRWRLPTPEITLSYIISCTDNRCRLLYISELFSISTWGRRCHHALSCMLKRCSSILGLHYSCWWNGQTSVRKECISPLFYPDPHIFFLHKWEHILQFYLKMEEEHQIFLPLLILLKRTIKDLSMLVHGSWESFFKIFIVS